MFTFLYEPQTHIVVSALFIWFTGVNEWLHLLPRFKRVFIVIVIVYCYCLLLWS